MENSNILSVTIIAPYHPIRSYEVGGGQAKFVRYLMNCKYDNIIIYNISNTGLFKQRKTNKIIGKYFKPLRTIIIFIRVIHHCIYKKVDIVHIFSPSNRMGIYEKLVFSTAVRLMGIITVFNFRGDFALSSVTWLAVEHKIIRLFLSLNNSLLCQFNKLSDYLINSYNIRADKLHSIPNGININEFNMKDYSQKSTVDFVRIIFIGSIGYHKGIDLVLSAVKILIKKYDYKTFEFNIYGFESISGYINEVLDIIKRDALENYITIHGPIHGIHKDQVIQESDIFILPSRSEGFPNAVLEAMLCGLPVVASDVGAIPEIINSGENGYVFFRENILDFVEKLEYLIEDVNLRERLGRAARNTVLEKYNIDNIMSQYMNLYRTLSHNK